MKKIVFEEIDDKGIFSFFIKKKKLKGLMKRWKKKLRCSKKHSF